MFIATTEEMRTMDQTAINGLGIPGVVLMENAGLRVVDKICEILGENLEGKRVTILAGKGNNGGDGLVIARHLLNKGAEVKTLLLANPEEISGDARVNLDILTKIGHKIYPAVNDNSLNIVKVALVYTDLIVDAIYGTGFRGMLNEHVGRIVQAVADSEKPVVSVDIPSGVEGDTGRINGPAIRADYTVTFGLPKLGNLLQPGADYGGQLEVADISMPPVLVESMNLKHQLITSEMVDRLIPVRRPDCHKGDCGRALVVGGSVGLTGAAALASMAALRCGAGLVTLGVPQGLNTLMEVKLTEVMTTPLADTGRQTLAPEAAEQILDLAKGIQVLALGPGLSRDKSTVEMVHRLVPRVEVPLVIDADGLNALAERPGILSNCKAPLVLTPHPGEMARLCNRTIDEVQNDRLAIARWGAKTWKAVVVLKGANTVIACPDGRVYINNTGNPGLATGGTGDVLTGIIAGLLAQGLTPEQAAVAGVYIHGRAADSLTESAGLLGMVAGDLLSAIPVVTRAYGRRG